MALKTCGNPTVTTDSVDQENPNLLRHKSPSKCDGPSSARQAKSEPNENTPEDNAEDPAAAAGRTIGL